MAAQHSRLRISQDERVTRVTFLDRNIVDEAVIQAIADEVGQIIETQSSPHMLIDFHDVDHLSSAALSALITIRNRVGDRDGELRLANIDSNIREVFSITRLDQIFKIHDTDTDAIASFPSE